MPAPVVVRERYWLHILLFLSTLATTTFAGVQLVGREVLYAQLGVPAMLLDGLLYSVPLLFFLTVHEFGHYFAARYHNVSVTLPYYVPSPLFFVPMNIGTFGAIIRIRHAIPSLRKLFDIGVAGPVAGFVASLMVLGIGIVTMPGWEYLMDLGGHESLKAELLRNNGVFPEAPASNEFPVYIGQTPLFWLLTQFVDGMPPMYELYHYPILFAGWLGLFFTALNLLPVGQLDGGHVLYALVGPKWHGRIARGFVLMLLLSATIEFVSSLAPYFGLQMAYGEPLSWVVLVAILFTFGYRMFNRNVMMAAYAVLGLLVLSLVATAIGPAATQYGHSGWFLWCVLIVWFIRIDHPPVMLSEPLTPGRRALAIACLIVFFLCFSIRPIYVAG
ncbi:MAG: site-2 protease family protein [Bacteroidota bacterium]